MSARELWKISYRSIRITKRIQDQIKNMQIPRAKRKHLKAWGKLVGIERKYWGFESEKKFRNRILLAYKGDVI